MLRPAARRSGAPGRPSRRVELKETAPCHPTPSDSAPQPGPGARAPVLAAGTACSRPAARTAGPPAVAVEAVTLAGAPDRAGVRLRRNGEVAPVDDGPAPGRGLRHADPRAFRRRRAAGDASARDRSQHADRGGGEPRLAAREPRGGPALRGAGGRPRPDPAAGRGVEPGRAGAGGHRRSRPRARSSRPRRRSSGSSGWRSATTSSARRPPVSSATCPCASATASRARRC